MYCSVIELNALLNTTILSGPRPAGINDTIRDAVLTCNQKLT